jgi:hypothetical protein
LGTSYELEFATYPKRRDKKHASYLLPYPPELIPFELVNGPDNRYSQLYKPIGKMPYKEASIEGFTPPLPFAIPAHLPARATFRIPIFQHLPSSMTSLTLFLGAMTAF